MGTRAENDICLRFGFEGLLWNTFVHVVMYAYYGLKVGVESVVHTGSVSQSAVCTRTLNNILVYYFVGAKVHSPGPTAGVENTYDWSSDFLSLPNAFTVHILIVELTLAYQEWTSCKSVRPWKSWVTRLQILQFLTSVAFGAMAMKQMWERFLR